MRRVASRAVTATALALGALLGLVVSVLGIAVMRQDLAAANNHPLDDVVTLVGALILVVGAIWLLFLWHLSRRVRKATA